MSRWFDWLEWNSFRISTETISQFEMLKYSSRICDFSPIPFTNTHRIFWIVFRLKPQSLVEVNVISKCKFKGFNFSSGTYTKARIVFEQSGISGFNFQPVISMSDVVSWPIERFKWYKSIMKRAHYWSETRVFLEFFSVFFFFTLNPVVLGLF